MDEQDQFFEGKFLVYRSTIKSKLGLRFTFMTTSGICHIFWARAFIRIRAKSYLKTQRLVWRGKTKHMVQY